MDERWAAIPSYEGSYEVSTTGRVRSLTRIIDGRQCTGRILKEQFAKGHHPSVRIYLAGQGKTFGVHRLVLLAFVGPPPEGMETCHYNGNWKDNRLENLRWDTSKNNSADAMRHGTHLVGEQSCHAKITAHDVVIIRGMGNAGILQDTIGSMFGLAQSQVSRILRHVNWKHI